jgi:cobaltochelatase CobT
VDAEQLGGAMTDKLAELFDEETGPSARGTGRSAVLNPRAAGGAKASAGARR